MSLPPSLALLPAGTLAHGSSACRTSLRPKRSVGGRRPDRPAAHPRSFDLDGGADPFELLLRLVGLLLGDLLEDRLWGAVHEVLRLLETEARERAHLLDHLDLLVARGREDHVELRLLLRLLAAG